MVIIHFFTNEYFNTGITYDLKSGIFLPVIDTLNELDTNCQCQRKVSIFYNTVRLNV